MDNGSAPPECGRPESLPVLFAGDQQWTLLTSKTYQREHHGKPHVHRWPDRLCSLLVEPHGD